MSRKIKNKYQNLRISCRLLLFWYLAFVPCFLAYSQDEPSGKEQEEELSSAVGAFENGFYDVGLNLLNKFISRFPQSAFVPEAGLYIGRCYFNLKQYAMAIEQLSNLLDSEKSGTFKDRVYYWLAESYFRNQDAPSAYNFYEKLTMEYPDSIYFAQAFYSLGWCLFEQGKFMEAKDRFSVFRDKFPSDPLAREADYKVAECLYSLKDYRGLKSYAGHLEKVYYPGPDSAGAEASGRRLIKFYLAESAFYLKDYAYAIDNYKQAFSQDSDDNFKNSLYLGLGWSYLKSGDYASALDNFAKPLYLEGGSYFENALLGRALALAMSSRFSEAIEEYDKLISRSKDAAIVLEARIGKAEALYNQENYSQSILAYKEAEDCVKFGSGDSFSDRISYGLALSYLKSGDTTQALKKLSSLAENSKDDSLKVSALAEIAGLSLESGESKKAIGIYEGILRDYPDSQSAEAVSFYLGTTYYEQGDFLNSYMRLRSLMSRYPLSAYKARALSLQGLSLKSLSRFQDAYDIFKEASKLNAQDAQASSRAEFEMADCLYSLGRIEEALSKLEYLRSKYSGFEVSFMALWRLAEHYFWENKLDLSRRYLLDIIQGAREVSARDDAYYLLGMGYEKDGRYKEALEAFKNIERGGQKVYLKIAGIHKSLADFAEAGTYYRRIIQEGAPEDKAEARLGLAECLEESGQLDEAAIEYQAISPQADKDILVKGYLRAAKIYEDKEDMPKAVEIYEKIAGLGVEESKFAKERISEIQKP